MKNKFGVDWSVTLGEQVIEYLKRCLKDHMITDFQKDVLVKMIKNGVEQSHK